MTPKTLRLIPAEKMEKRENYYDGGDEFDSGIRFVCKQLLEYGVITITAEQIAKALYEAEIMFPKWENASESGRSKAGRKAALCRKQAAAVMKLLEGEKG